MTDSPKMRVNVQSEGCRPISTNADIFCLFPCLILYQYAVQVEGRSFPLGFRPKERGKPSHANRTDCSARRKRSPATLWRDRTDRLILDRGVGPPGP